MIQNNRLHFLFLTALTILSGGLLAYLFKYPPEFLIGHLMGQRSEATCQGDISSLSFKIHPSFYLNKKFLSPKPLSQAEALAYAEKHIRYIHTGIPGFEKEQTPKFSVIPYDGYTLKNIEITEAKYPLSLEISKTDINPRFLRTMKSRDDIDSLYMAKALEAGATSLEDEALKVTYDAEIKLVLCQTKQNQFANKVNLPTDPFLGFWFVPPSQRIEKYNEVFKKNERITACATEEFLYDHDPYYYWYYWSLDHKQCHENLTKNSVQVYPVKNLVPRSLQTQHPFDLKFLDKIDPDRELKITVNFTLIDDDSVFQPEPFHISLQKRIDSLIANPNFDDVKVALNGLNRYDITLQTGLAFAWSVKSLSDDFVLTQTTFQEMLLQWILRGKLKQSQKRYEIFVTIGSAMKENPSYEKFYLALNQGLASSDIVYFGGHSGAGKNLSQNRIQEQVVNFYDSLPAKNIPDQQLVVLMTCYSLRYFPMNAFPVPDKSFVRDMLYTASVPAGYDARMLVGLIEQADRYLAKGRHLPFEKWPQQYNGDVFLLHQRSQR